MAAAKPSPADAALQMASEALAEAIKEKQQPWAMTLIAAAETAVKVAATYDSNGRP